MDDITVVSAVPAALARKWERREIARRAYADAFKAYDENPSIETAACVAAAADVLQAIERSANG